MKKHLLLGVTLAFSFGLLLTGCTQKKQVNNLTTFGIISDVHQDLQTDAAERLQVFIDEANQKNPDFIVQLGDLSHGEDVDNILSVWNQFKGPNYHVFGNHDADNNNKDTLLLKQEMPARYYSYDVNGVHFVVLDLNYLIDNGVYKDFERGNNYAKSATDKNLISPEQYDWLDQDLAATSKPTIVFTHQGIGDLWPDQLSADYLKIQQLLEKHNQGEEKKVIACFSGDQHVDTYHEKNGIHYFQINSASYFWIEEAAVFSNGHMAEYKDPLYAFITVDTKNKTLEVKGVESEFKEPAPTQENYSKMHKAIAKVSSRTVSF